MLKKIYKQLVNASCYSYDGLLAAYQHEFAFRLEVWLTVIAIPLALLIGQSSIERVVLIGSWLVVLIVELMNSAIEATIDRISMERHELAKRAKDLGSAAVFVACVNAAIIWVVLLLF